MAKIKIKFNNTEYSIDPASLADATARLEAYLTSMVNGSEVLEGDGAEYYTLAPTPLSFRSTAPLSELQEVTINGEVVDPSNYTLEEGSTIVTFPIEYLKTLATGDYEVAVNSQSKSVKGNFTVTAPELNEYGFYYNQPYTAYVSMFGENESFFIREDGTLDVVGTPSGDISQCTYTCSGNQMTVVSPVLGTLTATIFEDGSEIFCNELQIAFKLGNEAIASDEDYMYIYKEDLGGYEVKCIDKTKASYGAIKTGINGIDTVKLADEMFYNNNNIIVSPDIPDTVTTIGKSAFDFCGNLKRVVIGKGIAFIGENAFRGCASVSDVYVANIVSWCNINFANAFSTPAYYARVNLHINGEIITNLIIPDSVTSIGDYAFRGVVSLTSVTIPSSVTSIGDTAFDGCHNLERIYINDIAAWCSIDFTGGIGKDIYLNNKLVTNLIIPDNIISISANAFRGCNSLSSVTFDENSQLTTIGNSAFWNCSNLTSIVIPNSVTSIGIWAFGECDNLTSITFVGTTAQWNAIAKGGDWNQNVPATHVHCIDGDVAL